MSQVPYRLRYAARLHVNNIHQNTEVPICVKSTIFAQAVLLSIDITSGLLIDK